MTEKFINAIHSKNIVRVTFNSKEKGIITRKCIPFDFAPSSRAKVKVNKFQLYDLDSPSSSHNLAIAVEQLISLEILNEKFDPADYVKWTNISWLVPRDWGDYS